MSCLGVHFALTETDASHLLAATGDDSLLEYIQEVIEDRWDEDWLYQSDKAWDAIHRCLCDGSLASDRGTYPLKLAVLGGRQLYSKDDCIVSLVTPTEVRDVAASLEAITIDALRDRYDAIDQEDYGYPKSEEDWEYTRDNFLPMIAFFRKASTAGRYVIFSVDQ